MKISVVMPAYNEAANIENTVSYCFDVLTGLSDEVEVVVTNDGSKDETGTILGKLKSKYPGLVVLENNPNQGYGAALTKAFYASTGDVVVSLDSDGQFDIADTKEMLPLLTGDVDIVSGYRKAKKDSLFKIVADRIMNRMIRIMFGVSDKDTNCALKLYKGEVIRSMNLEARGFQLPTEIVLKAHATGLKVIEAPVNHQARPGGQSSLAPIKTGWSMFVFLLYLRRKISLYRSGVLRSL
ncbi:glycosyltransferase family 2 protein [bacterium]|nr:glycosyltransferase family 2 protein [bacterium]